MYICVCMCVERETKREGQRQRQRGGREDCGSLSFYCRKGNPFQGPKVGSCLTLGIELSKETHMLTKQEILLRKGAWVESSRVRDPGELLCHMARSLRFSGYGISFQVVFSQSFWLRVLPKMDGSEKDSGRWLDTWCHLLTFPELSLLMVAY